MAKKTDDLHELVKNRLTLAKKFAEEYQKQVKSWLEDYQIDSLEDIQHDDDLHNLMQIPYIFATIESQLPTIFENIPELIITKRGKKDKDFTDFTNLTWDYVQDIIKLKEKVENAGFNFLVLGQSSGQWGWRLETEMVEEEVQEQVPVGDSIEIVTRKKQIEVPIINQPYLKIHQHNRIYFSPESYFTPFDTENEIPYVIIEELMSPDEVKAEWNVEVDEDTYLDVTEFGDNTLETMTDEVKGDLKRVHVFNYMGTLPKEESQDKNWRPSKVYSCIFTQSKYLKEGQPVDHKPIALMGNYGTYNKFFRFGEPKVMRELEQDISLGRSTIADYRDKIATKIALDMNTEIDEYNMKSPKKMAFVRYTGGNPPIYMKPPSIPEAVMTALNMSKADAQMVSAQLDIARGGTQSVVDTATGQKIFETANERRINRKRKKIGDFIKVVAIQTLKLCAENWDLAMFAKITDLDPEEIQAKGFIEKLQEIDTLFNVDVDVQDVVTNKAQKSAQAISLYRETKEDPMVNREEILRNALEIGFEIKDWERFINTTVTPEQAMRALEYFVQMGLVPPELAQEMANVIMQQSQEAANPGGRPPTQDPTAILQKSMPGADANQMTAQNEAAFKQQGVPKQQGV